MSNKVNLIFLLFLIFTISCVKQRGIIQEYWGEASASKNNTEWNSFPSGRINSIHNKLSVSCNTYSDEGYHREDLLLFKIPLSEGTYKVEKTRSREEDGKTGAIFFTSTDDGDVTGDIYDISESDSTSTISITKIEGEEIWGTFDLILYRDTTRAYKGNPDILEFRNGMFHTKILK